MLASVYSFKKIIGIEYSRETLSVAEKNLATFMSKAEPACHDIELINVDAKQYDVPDDTNIVFIYNSFAFDIMNCFLINIEKSLERRNRKIYILYYNPACNEQHIYPEKYQYISIYDSRWFYGVNVFIAEKRY